MIIRELQDEIIRLKKEKDICILAHAYQRQDIWEVADYIGDSFGLSQKAAEVEAQTVMMCGVRFMAETVKILSPQKTVLLANPIAGCPMADQMDKELIGQMKESMPDHTVVAYINTTAELKTVCDVCVTSSSAVKIIRNIPNDKILFMPYYVFNFSDGFREKVIEKFVRSYESGATPNPCIDCNRYMKFDKLYERARILGCEYIVTGHYARIEEQDGKYVLKKALDETKDQSYVLYSLTQEQLAHTLFPLGKMRKTAVRKIAEENGFFNADKPDSQDICFVPNGKYAEFLEYYTGKSYPAGDFLSVDGIVLGKHKGIIRYTVGQHKGLGIPSAPPLYVKEINARQNTITLCEVQDLYSKELIVGDFHWISEEPPQPEMRCKAKVRYRQKEQSATVISIGNHTVKVVFDKPQRAVTPGQAAVLYSGDIVLGGGTISKYRT